MLSQRDTVSHIALIALKVRDAVVNKQNAEYEAALTQYRKGEDLFRASQDTFTSCGWDEDDSMEWRLRYDSLPHGEKEIAQALLKLNELSKAGYAPATQWLAQNEERQNWRYAMD